MSRLGWRRQWRAGWLGVGLAGLLTGCAPTPPPPARPAAAPRATARQPAAWTGRCVGVTDGDTIRVLHHGREEKLRLAGVDAPEHGQAFGQRAKQFTSDLVFDRDVTVIPRETDRYGRTVADVLTGDGRSVNEALVAAGLAWWYRQYARDNAKLAQLEQQAKAARRGLWADPRPVEPSQFRHPPAKPRPAATPRPTPPARTAVWATSHGQRFHRAGCSALRGHGQALDPAAARSRGLTPCPLCRP